MRVPIKWLAEYVELPKKHRDLTDKLTMIGHLLDKEEKGEKDTIIDLELRGNRADLLGIWSIAREVHASFGTKLTLPKLKNLSKKVTVHKECKITVDDKKLVNRFYTVVVPVKVGPSPSWMTERLTQFGVASINNVVDITNYVMAETGQPLHAFDIEKLVGNELILRRAKNGEELVTLDGTVIKLDSEDLLIADKEGPAALAGAIGGSRTGISETTKYILLEGGNYDRVNVRRTARKHALRTEASTRLEKFLDLNLAEVGVNRAIQLLVEHAGSKAPTAYTDFYPRPTKPLIIDFDPTEVTRLGGVQIDNKTVISILKKLDFQVKERKNKLLITVPTLRTDIEQSADIVEEVLRIWGFENIPSFPDTRTPAQQLPADIALENESRTLLTALGLNEVITLPIITQHAQELFHPDLAEAKLLKITNPPAPDQDIMRTSLIPNLVDYLTKNYNFGVNHLAFFEVGKTYLYADDVLEKKMIGGVLGGTQRPNTWQEPNPPAIDFLTAKGILESYLSRLGINASFKPFIKAFLTPGRAATISINGKEVGYVGEITKKIILSKKLKASVVAFELNIEALLTHIKPKASFVLAPQYPPILEDITFVVHPDTSAEELQSLIQSTSELITSVRLTAVYKNTLTYRIQYRSTERTLTDPEVQEIHTHILKQAKEKLSVEIKN